MSSYIGVIILAGENLSSATLSTKNSILIDLGSNTGLCSEGLVTTA
jgi:hypothetical protein